MSASKWVLSNEQRVEPLPKGTPILYPEALVSSPDDREELASDGYILISICDNRHLGGGPYGGQFPARVSDNRPTLCAFLLDLPARPLIVANITSCIAHKKQNCRS